MTFRSRPGTVREVLAILKLPGNESCAECGSNQPQWASINIGIVLCIKCSGLHRQLGSHISKVRSLTLDVWEPSSIDFVRRMGNIRSKSFWEASAPSSKPSGEREMIRWLNEVYVHRRYVDRFRQWPAAFLAPLAELRSAPGTPMTPSAVSSIPQPTNLVPEYRTTSGSDHPHITHPVAFELSSLAAKCIPPPVPRGQPGPPSLPVTATTSCCCGDLRRPSSFAFISAAIPVCHCVVQSTASVSPPTCASPLDRPPLPLSEPSECHSILPQHCDPIASSPALAAHAPLASVFSFISGPSQQSTSTLPATSALDSFDERRAVSSRGTDPPCDFASPHDEGADSDAIAARSTSHDVPDLSLFNQCAPSTDVASPQPLCTCAELSTCAHCAARGGLMSVSSSSAAVVVDPEVAGLLAQLKQLQAALLRLGP